MYTVAETAEIFGKSEDWIRDRVRDNLLTKVGTAINRQSIELLLGHPVATETVKVNPAEKTELEKELEKQKLLIAKKDTDAIEKGFDNFDAEKADFEEQKKEFQSMQEQYSDFDIKKKEAEDAIKKLADAKLILTNANNSAKAIVEKAQADAESYFTNGKAKLVAENASLLNKMDGASKDLIVRISLYGDFVNPSIQAVKNAYDILIKGLERKLTPQQISTVLNTELSKLDTFMQVCQAKDDYQSLLKKKGDTK